MIINRNTQNKKIRTRNKEFRMASSMPTKNNKHSRSSILWWPNAVKSRYAELYEDNEIVRIPCHFILKNTHIYRYIMYMKIFMIFNSLYIYRLIYAPLPSGQQCLHVWQLLLHCETEKDAHFHKEASMEVWRASFGEASTGVVTQPCIYIHIDIYTYVCMCR